MKDFVILPDCTCDLSPEARNDVGMTDYIPGHVNLNGTEFPTTLTWEHFTREEYYKTLSRRYRFERCQLFNRKRNCSRHRR